MPKAPTVVSQASAGLSTPQMEYWMFLAPLIKNTAFLHDLELLQSAPCLPKVTGTGAARKVSGSSTSPLANSVPVVDGSDPSSSTSCCPSNGVETPVTELTFPW